MDPAAVQGGSASGPPAAAPSAPSAHGSAEGGPLVGMSGWAAGAPSHEPWKADPAQPTPSSVAAAQGSAAAAAVKTEPPPVPHPAAAPASAAAAAALPPPPAEVCLEEGEERRPRFNERMLQACDTCVTPEHVQQYTAGFKFRYDADDRQYYVSRGDGEFVDELPVIEEGARELTDRERRKERKQWEREQQERWEREQQERREREQQERREREQQERREREQQEQQQPWEQRWQQQQQHPQRQLLQPSLQLSHQPLPQVPQEVALEPPQHAVLQPLQPQLPQHLPAQPPQQAAPQPMAALPQRAQAQLPQPMAALPQQALQHLPSQPPQEAQQHPPPQPPQQAAPQPMAAPPQQAQAQLPQPMAALPQQAPQHPAPQPAAGPEPPVESLSLDDLRQAFFDQPAELSALRARLAELEELRKQCVFPDGGALWDGLLARLRRYLHLLEQEGQQVQQADGQPQKEAGAAQAAPKREPFVPRCDLCGRQQAPGAAPPLRRMQLMGARQHLAVCGACADARRGTLIPLTPTWQLDPVAWGALVGRTAPAMPAAKPAPGGGGGRGRGRKKDAAAGVSDAGDGSRPGSAVGHRGKSTFKATSCAWLKLVTKGNLQPSAGLAPRIYLPFGVYWSWVDRLPGAEGLASEADAPRAMRLAHEASGAAWHVPLLRTDDGMQLQPAALRPLFDQLGVAVDSSLLIELREEECSLAGGFVATVKLIGRGEPQPELPGGPIGVPRNPVTASGLQACKKRKGTHTSSRQERGAGDGGGDTATAHAAAGGGGGWAGGGGGGRGRANSEAFEWDEAWDERSDADVSFSLPAGQPVDGPAAGRSRRRGAGSRLASILRQEVPEPEDEADDEDYVVAPEQAASEQDEVDQAPLPFEPRGTPSIRAALELAMALHPDVTIPGAHAPSAGTTQKWGVYIKRSGYQQQWFGRLDRPRAAVAADVVMTWQGRLARQVEMEKLLSGEPQYGAAAPASGPTDGGEAAELAAEVAAMAALAAGLGPPPSRPGSALPRAGSFSGMPAASEDVDMAEAGEEAEATTAAAPGAGGRVPRRLNLPEAGYLQDAELMQQLGQIESPYQLLLLLTAIIPQDPLPRHLQRHALRPPSEGWAAAAVCTLPGSQAVTLRVSGLPTLEQAEVARDLLALWGWQAAQRQQAQQAQQPTASAADGAAGSGGGVEGTAPAAASPSPPSPPPLPPLNFPYSAYAEHTAWLQDLANLGVEEVERFACAAAQQLSKEAFAELQAAAGLPAAAAPAAAPAATPAAVEATAPSEAGEEQSEGSSEPAVARGEVDHFDLLAALADVAGGELGPTPERRGPPPLKQEAEGPAGPMGAKHPGGAGRLAAGEAAAAAGQVPGSPFAAQQHAQQLKEQPAPAPQPQAQPGEAAFLRQPSTASAAGQRPGSPGGAPPLPSSPAGGLSGAGSGGAALAARVEAATQRKVAQALAAFEEADLTSADSMLRPLRLLAVANKGGQLLRDIVRSWPSYTRSQQQEVFDAVLMATNEQDWGPQLEETLRLALELL
ncbi:hypothetical protein ABPG75_000610 [Micractinium tetrahymenae]